MSVIVVGGGAGRARRRVIAVDVGGRIGMAFTWGLTCATSAALLTLSGGIVSVAAAL
ncbi:MAG: hypothetical protein OXP66_11290 [Candidatus Tectomicrobia bacterium]|nr:hypothetical protein [Candidatus Tectomicrobia bacterium]